MLRVLFSVHSPFVPTQTFTRPVVPHPNRTLLLLLFFFFHDPSRIIRKKRKKKTALARTVFTARSCKPSTVFGTIVSRHSRGNSVQTRGLRSAGGATFGDSEQCFRARARLSHRYETLRHTMNAAISGFRPTVPARTRRHHTAAAAATPAC